MDLQTVIEGILAIRKKIEGSWANPNALSDLGHRLAHYNSYLGDHLGDYEHDREIRKGTSYLDYLKQGVSDTGADNRSRAEVAELTGNIKKLKLMHDDADKQISMIQSRLRVLEANRRNET